MVIFMKEKLYRFMAGRYGNDNLNRFLLIVALVLVALSWVGSNVFAGIGFACLIYIYFRMLSKNTYKRARENQVYMSYVYKIKNFLNGKKREFEQRKIYHIYKCPSCKQKIRIPRGKGKIEIKCPKCGQTFIKNS